MKIDVKNRNTSEPIIWEGDLEDDCLSKWAGLLLRAEWMNKKYWWWAVYDMENNQVIVDSSNRYTGQFKRSEIVRNAAERSARNYLSLLPKLSIEELLKD